jgi:hypothetical protein
LSHGATASVNQVRYGVGGRLHFCTKSSRQNFCLEYTNCHVFLLKHAKK